MWLFDFTLLTGLESLIFLAVLFAAVAYESFFLPIVALIIAWATFTFVNHVDFSSILHSLSNNKILTLALIVGYVLMGIAWSSFKWFTLVHDVGKAIEKKLQYKYNNTRIYDVTIKGTSYAIPLKASKNKERILVWMVYWWISIPITVFGDWMRRFWNYIYELVSGIYQRIADKYLNHHYAKVDEHNKNVK